MNITSARRYYVLVFGAFAAVCLSLSASAGGIDCQQKMTHVDAEGSSSGRISASDHAAQADKRFAKMDVNKDGNVTAAEIDASHGAESMVWAKHRLSSAEKLSQLDSDGDGTLTRAEYASGSQKMFRKLDLDSDGMLTAAEMQSENLTAHGLN